ncbi:G protein-coupled receptor kinase 1 [Cichlidogyrus casuarinus]|uniref:G protein-coupled receptor kinase n=1 Tax=Cichlidogyrus casuarinus TaxID=1844966 RepID=A0ABD2QII3_9PLAT
MADLEAVLADVSYLLAMEKSKTLQSKPTKLINLPDSSLNSTEERIKEAKHIYNRFIMSDLLCQDHGYSRESVDFVQENLVKATKTGELAMDLFKPYVEEIRASLNKNYFDRFLLRQVPSYRLDFVLCNLSSQYTRFCQWKCYEYSMVLSLNDFSLLRIIGRGGFGEVYGCRKLDTGRMYAMKCLDKKRIKVKGSVRLVLNERSMLYRVSSGTECPFIVCMTYAFQTTEKLCFVLDLMSGGDLHYHLMQHSVFSEAEVRFYGTEILLGLEHMHRRSIVYRDLKPANILLDEWGHVRISDLGLACDFSRRLPTAGVGTHGYMAPEVLNKNVAYNNSADYFSYGCFLYKLVCGHSPFRQNKAKTKQEIDKLTLKLVRFFIDLPNDTKNYSARAMLGISTVEFPNEVSESFRDLVTNLLKQDAEVRLGCDQNGIDGIKNHSFFEDIDWKAVYAKRYAPPLIPPEGEVNAADAFEIGIFDDQDVQNIKLTSADQKQYENFQLIHAAASTVNSTTTSPTKNMEGSMSPANDTDRVGSPISHCSPVDLLLPINKCVINTWPIDLLVEWWLAPEAFGTGNNDCILEGELLRLCGPFMQNWSRRHIRLFPNRIELYHKTRDGIPLKTVEVSNVSQFY